MSDLRTKLIDSEVLDNFKILREKLYAAANKLIEEGVGFNSNSTNLILLIDPLWHGRFNTSIEKNTHKTYLTLLDEQLEEFYPCKIITELQLFNFKYYDNCIHFKLIQIEPKGKFLCEYPPLKERYGNYMRSK